ncbi:MAG TPA: DNA-3-methyladenine glycosylase [Thermoanaerobaculia bacterium]|jgi:DNA-3-methyladenine glycosylase|nr:DNA-3-methyladenine glycosylase [Thermoanaerobaculia bacterium]
MKPAKLPADFYLHDTVTVARALLGCVLWRRVGRELLAARLVETEAYLGANDAASHARRGLRSARNESMYLEGGHAYVYFTYGMHWCLNVVTQEADIAEAVLLRGAQPLRGIESMRKRRPKAKRDYDLMNGPGKICSAMAIDKSVDGESLRGERLFITARDIDVDEDDIAVSSRIGVEGAPDAAHWPLRFFLKGNRYVSAYRNV